MLSATPTVKAPLDVSGYSYSREDRDDRTVFRIYHGEDADRNIMAIIVQYPRERRTWGGSSLIDPAYISGNLNGSADANDARAYGQVLFMAAAVCEQQNSNIAEKIEAQRQQAEERERERQAAREQARRERDERERLANAKWAELTEKMQWQLEERIKTKRTHARSTITGTIKSVRPRGMSIITERDQPMDLQWSELEYIDLKLPGRGKYDRVYQGPTEAEIRAQRGW